MATPFEQGYYFGSTGAFILVLGLTGYALYLSIKRRDDTWGVLLVFNFVLSLFLIPVLLAIILPIIYLIKMRESKETKDKHNKKKTKKRT